MTLFATLGVDAGLPSFLAKCWILAERKVIRVRDEEGLELARERNEHQPLIEVFRLSDGIKN